MKFVALALALVAADHPMVCEPVESDGGTATGRVLRACEAALREERDKTFACEKALAEYRPARLFCPVCGRRCDACPDVDAHGWAPHVVICRESSLKAADLAVCAPELFDNGVPH